jgi:acyl carrier protein
MPAVLDSPIQHSAESVLLILQEVLNSEMGKTISISNDTRIDRYFKEIGCWDDIDLMDVSHSIEKEFGISISNEDWQFLAGPSENAEEWESKYASFFTFGRLANLIAQRAKVFAVKPAVILGSKSLAAGAFLQIEKTASEINPAIERFAPSTRIEERFYGRNLRVLWAKCRVLSGNHISPLEQGDVARVLYGVFSGNWGIAIWLTLAGALAYLFHRLFEGIPILRTWPWFTAVVSAIYIMTCTPRLVLALCERMGIPEFILPEGIETFRDLCIAIARKGHSRCINCGGSLEGQSLKSCSQCGASAKQRRADSVPSLPTAAKPIKPALQTTSPKETSALPGDSNRLYADDVLPILQTIMNEATQLAIPITRESRIDLYFKQTGEFETGIDLLDLSFRINAEFGISITNEDWAFLAGTGCTSEEWEATYAPFFTFGRLIDLIIERAQLGVARPLTILGATSKAAGAFRQVEMFARTIRPKVKPFGPSTQILDRFRGGDLRKLWGRLRAVSGNRIPPLAKPPSSRIEGLVDKPVRWVLMPISVVMPPLLLLHSILEGYPLGVLGQISLGAAVVAMLFLVTLLLLMVGAMILRAVIGAFESKKLVMPNGIRTFRDLAELIAGERGGWCEKCGYDLTGLTSSRCPECGGNREASPIPGNQ